MIKEKKVKLYFIGAAIMLFVAFMCRQVDFLLTDKNQYEVFFSSILITLRNTIHISLMVLWCVSLNNRIINDGVRKHVFVGGILLTYWIVARVCKNDFTFTEHEVVGRYFWYSYYIPMVLIPLFGFYIVNYIDKPEDYKAPLWQKLLLIPAFSLITIIMTNDLHQWVFSFPEGIENFENVYNYEFLYVITLSWMIFFGAYFVIMLMKKSRVPESQELQSLPIVIFGLAVIFWIMYCLRLITCDLTTVDCTIIVLLVESAIQCNMIPSNNNYIGVLSTSTIAAQIVDNDYNRKIVSSTAIKLTPDEIKLAEKEKYLVGTTIINTRPIVGGYVVWQEDIKEISELISALQDTKEQLGEENELLQAELSVRERRAKAEEKNRLYDRIAKDVSKQLKMVNNMLKKIERKEGDEKELLSKVCVIGSYIKRRGNLLLLGEREAPANAQELEFSIRETLNNLQLCDVYTAFDSSCEGEVKLKYMVAAYDLIEKLIELLLGSITAMMVKASVFNGNVQLNIQIGLKECVDKALLEELSVKYTKIDYELQDEDIIINADVNWEVEKNAKLS